MNQKLSTKHDEKGVVAIVVAIMMTVFLGFAAVVVDVGYLYEIRRQMQSAADAGALAGCQEMVLQTKEPDVVALSEAVAIDYAINRNLAEEATPTVDLVDQSVTVVASRKVDLFFARIFGFSDEVVSAIAKAEVAYLVGVKDLDPMGVPNPKPKEIKVEVVNQSSGQVLGPYTLGVGNFVNDTYEYSSNIPVPATGDYRIDVISVNNQDFEEKIIGATALVVSSGSPVGEVAVAPNFISASTSTSITITAEVSGSPGVVEARWGTGTNKVALTRQGLTNIYKGTKTISLPATSDGYRSFPVNIKVDSVESSSTSAYIVAREAGIEVKDADLEKNYIVNGTQSSVSIDVKVQGFEYEQLYTLFLDNGTNYCGNSYGLDLDYAEKGEGTGLPDYPTGGQGNGNGADSLGDALAMTLHADPWATTHPYHYYRIGDYICTEPGSYINSKVKSGIEARIGTDSCTWDMWRNNTTPHDSRNQ